MPETHSVTVVSHTTVFPSRGSSMKDLKLSVSDLPMLSCHYIQKGNLFARPPDAAAPPVPALKQGLSRALSFFPPLAGRLLTDPAGEVYITCNDAGADFVHAAAPHIFVHDVLSPVDVPDFVNAFFSLDRTLSYDGHFRPILAVQVTELADGVFVGCSVNHAVTDGTSLWNFFNSLAEVTRGVGSITGMPDFRRESVLISQAVLKFPDGGPRVTFSGDEPLRERIFRFERDSVLKLKARVNGFGERPTAPSTELQSNGTWKSPEGWVTEIPHSPNSGEASEISSFQSLCALLWRAVTRARNLPPRKTTTFRMAVNCRHRLEPKLDRLYFGNAIQSIPAQATAGEVLSGDLRVPAEWLHRSVVAHDGATVRRYVEEWENAPRCFPLGNLDGGMVTMGSSPRFPMYENDFGWGRAVAVRSGRANKFDGKISAFPGREGGGSVELEVCLSPATMAGVEKDTEFMQYVSE